MKPSATNRPRILFLDDNIRDIGGHYLELASLLADGAKDLGYKPELVTHQTLQNKLGALADDPRLVDLPLHCEFNVRRMENWSLGVDGSSQLGRDFFGRAIGGTNRQVWSQWVRDRLCRRSRGPHAMAQRWASVFTKMVKQFAPTPGDRVIINTGGDFQLLALATSLPEWQSFQPVDIHAIFHFAVYQRHITDRAIAFGNQVNRVAEHLSPHRLHLHATTETLSHQLASVGVIAGCIPYPTRVQPRNHDDHRRRRVARRWSGPPRKKIVLAGLPRAEKGRDQIKHILANIEDDQLRSGRFQWSMQLPQKRWKRLLPDSLWELAQSPSNQVTQDSEGMPRFVKDSPIEVLSGSLASPTYHGWLDSADVGLFLYDSQRYIARCSGVLLEMMIRGVPVIVPNQCWLADQVRSAALRGLTIGWVYQSIEQIPTILSHIEVNYDKVNADCHQHALMVAKEHSGRTALERMGVPVAKETAARVAG